MRASRSPEKVAVIGRHGDHSNGHRAEKGSMIGRRGDQRSPGGKSPAKPEAATPVAAK